MKRALRICLRALAVLVVLVVVLLVVCLDGVDLRPYMRQPYYATTTARLETIAKTNVLVHGELSAGFGRARLTPTVNVSQDDPANGKFRSLPLAGFGGRHGRPAKGAHDDLFVKAVAFQAGGRVGVMVGTDALIVPSEVAEKAAAQLQRDAGLSREQLYLGATHTHSSLGGWGEGKVAESFAGGFQPEVRTWFANCIVAAVKAALADLKPAQFGQGSLNLPQFIRNRLVGDLGNVDPEFCYGLVKQNAGSSAVLGVYGAHATLLGTDNMEFSADYPGYWQRAVEQATGGTALFIAGGVGSHSAVPKGRGLAGAEQLGEELAQLVVGRLAATPLTNQVTFGMLGLEVDMPPLNVRLSDGVRLRPWLAARLVPARTQNLLQVFRLNDCFWISTPCDFSGELALGIKDFLRARGNRAVVTSFNGDYIGYVIPARYYHLNGYEPRLMSFFGPNVPDYFDELIRSMSLSLAKN